MLSIVDLPNEIIIHIFSFLRLTHRKNVRLVCKLWNELSYSVRLIKHDVTIIRNYLDIDKTLRNNSRHSNIQLILRLYDFQDTSVLNLRTIKFWSKHGEHIRSLNINCPGLFLQAIVPHILSSCPSLESLQMSTDCAMSDIGLRKVKFPELVDVKLWGYPDVVGTLLHIIVWDAPKLEKISLQCFAKHFESIPDAVLKEIFGKASELKDIEICLSDLSDDVVDLMTQTLGSNLKRFSLKMCSNFSDRSLEFLGKRCSNLYQLILGECRFSEAGIMAAISNLRQLAVVSLGNSSVVSDSVVSSLVVLSNLSHLELTFVNGEGVREALGNRVRPQMRELRLVATCINDDVIVKIAPNLPNLKILNLSFNGNISDVSLEAIFKYNIFLECLSVNCCPDIRRLHLPSGRSVNDLRQLVHLNVADVRLPMDCFHNLRLPFLRVLDYDDCFDCLTVGQSIEGCPSLQFWNDFCYDNEEATNKMHLLKCYNSPFGPCNENDAKDS